MADVAVTQDVPVFPLPDPGFVGSTLFAYASYGLLTGAEYLETHGFTLTTPYRILAGDWDNFIQNEVAPNLASQGLVAHAYGIWEQPSLNVTVPTSLCIEGLPCLDLTQLCLPFLGCLGGDTLISAYDYQVWFLTEQPDVTASGYLARGSAPRAVFPFIAMGILLIIAAFAAAFLIPLYIANMKEVSTGKLTSTQLVGNVKSIIPSPGQEIAQGISPLVTIGLISSVAGVAIALIASLNHEPIPPPPPQAGYNVNVGLPTPIGPISGGFGVTPAAPAPLPPPRYVPTPIRRP